MVKKGYKVIKMSVNNECLFDPSIEMNISILPKELYDYAIKLEELDKNDDWFHYSCLCEEFEVEAKSYYAADLITPKQWELIKKRYCGYY